MSIPSLSTSSLTLSSVLINSSDAFFSIYSNASGENEILFFNLFRILFFEYAPEEPPTFLFYQNVQNNRYPFPH